MSLPTIEQLLASGISLQHHAKQAARRQADAIARQQDLQRHIERLVREGPEAARGNHQVRARAIADMNDAQFQLNGVAEEVRQLAELMKLLASTEAKKAFSDFGTRRTASRTAEVNALREMEEAIRLLAKARAKIRMPGYMQAGVVQRVLDLCNLQIETMGIVSPVVRQRHRDTLAEIYTGAAAKAPAPSPPPPKSAA